ncbi:MAG: RNA polymerase sigma factor [Rikenellaceae bacterium]|nr:RNA polymerase sigma factor [Rikenellaceae bacterium]MCL2692933.1 RNA polymerase sigma factor [Rikenellaceae bacterium]
MSHVERYIILTDQQLIALSLYGDAHAFGHLFNRYRDSVHQLYVQRTGSNSDDADDLIQETFLKVYLNLERYNPAYTFGQWIFTIARNTFIDFVRKRQDNLSIDGSRYEGVALSPPSPLPTPEESIINRQQSVQLEEFLGRLKPHYRRMIEMRFYRGFSYEEIAEELAIPIGTVKTQLHRAREQLCAFIVDDGDMMP